MNHQNKEGALHPLTTRAPITDTLAAPPCAGVLPRTAPPLPKGAAPAAIASYGIGYLYVWAFLGRGSQQFWPYGLLFALLYVAGVEGFCRAAHRTPGRESLLWGGCYLAQSAALAAFGWWPGSLCLWQGLAWHGCAVCFALARTGMAAAGQSGSLCFVDALSGFVLLPFGGFFLRVRTLFVALGRRLRAAGSRKINSRGFVTAAASCLLALLLALYAWMQLCAADAQFALFGQTLRIFLNRRFLNNEALVEFFGYFILSLPVGAWLYGLVAGGLRRTAPPIPAAAFYRAAAPLAVLPVYTVGIVAGALCCLYALFFGVQAAELAGALARPVLTAPEASTLAVQGFWELCRVQLLNLTVLIFARFFVPGLRSRAPARVGLAAFCGFGFAFAALSISKLWVYIAQFGFTPRRVVSLWFACLLAVWALLALLWCALPQRRLPAARWGLWLLAVSFTALCLINLPAL